MKPAGRGHAALRSARFDFELAHARVYGFPGDAQDFRGSGYVSSHAGQRFADQAPLLGLLALLQRRAAAWADRVLSALVFTVDTQRILAQVAVVDDVLALAMDAAHLPLPAGEERLAGEEESESTRARRHQHPTEVFYAQSRPQVKGIPGQGEGGVRAGSGL